MDFSSFLQLTRIEQGLQPLLGGYRTGLRDGNGLGNRHTLVSRLFQQTAQDIGGTLTNVPGLAGDIEVKIVIKLDGFHRDALDSSKFGCGDYT